MKVVSVEKGEENGSLEGVGFSASHMVETIAFDLSEPGIAV